MNELELCSQVWGYLADPERQAGTIGDLCARIAGATAGILNENWELTLGLEGGDQIEFWLTGYVVHAKGTGTLHFDSAIEFMAGYETIVAIQLRRFAENINSKVAEKSK